MIKLIFRRDLKLHNNCIRFIALVAYEPRYEKTGLRGFRPGPTQTGLYRWLEAGNFEIRKERGCTIYVAKTKALISCAVTAQLICVFVFAYAKSRFSRNKAHMFITFTAHLLLRLMHQ